MLKTIRRMLDKTERLPKNLSYEEAVELLESHSAHARSELAEREDTRPEILYYLSNDSSDEVRRKVVRNDATPAHAFRHLSTDEDDEVRCELAHKIGRLLPGLESGEADRIRDFTIEALEKLAEDQLPRVRQIIAEEIKVSTQIPVTVVQRLAHDLEIAVAGPILEFSPLLSDDDLLEVIASGQVHGALECIARRAHVSGDVSDAVVASLDVPAVAALLNNKNAQIREDTLDVIIDNAKSVEEWHEPVAMRPELSLRAMRRIAGFVAFSLLSDLSERSDLSADVQAFLKKKVRSRIESEDVLDGDLADEGSAVTETVKALSEVRPLDAEFVAEAIESGQKAVVAESLATLSNLSGDVVKAILSSEDGKAITALVWKAGLPMRQSLALQNGIGHVPPARMVMARNGVDFSLSEEEMLLVLEVYVRQHTPMRG